KYPMMPLSLFRNRLFSGVNALTFFLYAGLSAAMLFLSLDMVQVQGFSQLEAGLSFLPFTILLMAVSPIAGALADKYGPRWLLVAGPLVSGAGMLLLATVGRVRGFQDYWASFFPGMTVFGLGMAVTVAPLTAAVMGAAGQQFSGVASGVNNALSRVAGVLANAILGALAVLMFVGMVRQRAGDIPLPGRMEERVEEQTRNLGNAKAPAGLSARETTEVNRIFRDSFAVVYQRLLRISAGLAFAGALTGFFFVKDGGHRNNGNRPEAGLHDSPNIKD
ncbi:MAG TPA: MFS transporter, partial [Puia sp.]|nr:MFS transporter [Puia sp.]